jgi:hypothetical protein
VFRRFVHFEVLVIYKYRYGENIFPRDVKFCPRRGNPPTAYQHLSLAGSRTGRSWVGVQAKEIRKKYIPGQQFYVAGKNILAATVLVNDKYFKMHEAAKLKHFKFKY